MKTLVLLAILATLLTSPAWATTTEEEQRADTTTAIQQELPMDLAPQDAKDVFDLSKLSFDDPYDISYDHATETWTVGFWVDPLNDWMGKPPVGAPPFEVYATGLPDNACKFDKKMNWPKCVPLLAGSDGQADPGNVVWVITFKGYFKVNWVLFVLTADNRNVPGDMCMSACAYVGGGKCHYEMGFKKGGRVETPRCFVPAQAQK